MMQKPAMVAKMTEFAMQTRTQAHTEIRPSASATTSAGAEMAGRAGARVITSGRAKADTTTPGQGTSGAGQECSVTCGDKERQVPALSAPRHLLVAPGQEVGQGGRQVEGDHGEGGPVAGGESQGISQHWTLTWTEAERRPAPGRTSPRLQWRPGPPALRRGWGTLIGFPFFYILTLFTLDTFTMYRITRHCFRGVCYISNDLSNLCCCVVISI